jgi:[acyl-carrier-protein] S-malonyltransferase
MQTCRDLGVSAVIELAPAGTLTGIAKRELPGVELLAIKKPDDLERARSLAERRTEHGQGQHTPDWQVAVAPAKGVFARAENLAEGAQIAAGARIGTVRTNRDEHPVVSPSAGQLVEWLRADGDIVGAGLPIARVHQGVDS